MPQKKPRIAARCDTRNSADTIIPYQSIDGQVFWLADHAMHRAFPPRFKFGQWHPAVPVPAHSAGPTLRNFTVFPFNPSN